MISVQGCSRFTPSRSNPSLPKSPPQPVEVTLPSQVASDLPTLEAATHSGDAKALARYGSALAQSGRTKEGIGYLRRAVARDPQLTAAWHNLALVAESEGWLDVAANAYSKVVSAKPELAGEWVKFGYTLIALGRYAEAETAFKKAVALQPRSSETLVALASLYYADFHFDKALDTLN
ncbi:MAG: tetratricopeptide repeat protein, partial [bacterium]